MYHTLSSIRLACGLVLADRVPHVGKFNRRKNYPMVDNKLLTKRVALERDIPVPALYGVVRTQQQISRLIERLTPYEAFVVKPAQGSSGKGILVITGRNGDAFIKSSGAEISGADIRRHTSNILAGLHSID